MAKLLGLIKSYEEFKEQPPPMATPGETAEEASESGAVAGEHSTSDEAPRPHVPAASRKRSLQAPEAETDQKAAASPAQVAAPRSDARAGSAAPEGGHEGEEIYGEALQAVSTLCEATAMEGVSPDSLHAAASRIARVAISLVARTEDDDSLLPLALRTYPEGESFVLPHSVNVAILASYVGHQLGITAAELTRTVTAGLAHDIGNIHFPGGSLHGEDVLSNDEIDQVRRGPASGHDLLISLGEEFRPVAEIVLQVYERLDGSGYPIGLKGDQVLLEARILGAVDFFETTIHPRPYKDSLPGGVNFGIQTLMRMADQFGQDVLKALVRSVGLFPVGTYVHLSTGEVARVLRGNRGNPMRPVVEVVLDKRGRRDESCRQIDLVASPHLYVSKPLSKPELMEMGLVDAPAPAGDGATNEAGTDGAPRSGPATEPIRVPE